MSKEYYEEAQSKSSSSYIQFTPKSLARTYGVILKFEDEKVKQFQVHFEIEVICMEQLNLKEYKFEIFKKQVYFNQKAPETVIDELAERCGNTSYPLQLKINRIGKALKILNHDDIRARWNKEKINLRQCYSGNPYDKMIDSMDKILDNPSETEHILLEHDWFIKLFFAPIYDFNGSLKVDQVFSLPLIPYKLPVKYQIIQSIKNHPTRDGVIQIIRKGNCIDTRSENDIKKGNIISITKDEKLTVGTINLEYLLYKNSPMVDSIVGECSLNFASNDYKKLKIEIYNLKEKIPKPRI